MWHYLNLFEFFKIASAYIFEQRISKTNYSNDVYFLSKKINMYNTLNVHLKNKIKIFKKYFIDLIRYAETAANYPTSFCL